jgi:uncharacterized protein YgiM (DUF1202 family)
VREDQQQAAKPADESREPAAAPAATAAPAVQELTPAAYAERLRVNPASMSQVLAQLHQTHGNGFVQQVLAELQQAPSAGGAPLPAATRTKMEQAFGTDLSAVRVHQDGAAESTGAEAYTRGTDIHFASGKFDPGSTHGQELIGHEIAHVVQQSEGRASEGVQNKGGAVNADPSLEREADEAGARAAAGRSAGIGAGATLSAGAAHAPIQQKNTKINPVAATLKTKDEVLGDGTPALPGLSIDALEAYTTQQVDWFTEPSFSATDREAVWKVVNLFHYGPHVGTALSKLHTGEVAALPNRDIIKAYFDGFDPGSSSIQLTTPAASFADTVAIGTAIKELKTFIPGAVLRHVIPESGLRYLMSKSKIADLKTYYQTFRPSLEKPEEWEHVEKVLDEGIKTWMVLKDWVSELHIFTSSTRAQLKKNITDKSKAKPVLLVVMSALDWNTAFLQGQNVEHSLTDTHNLGLLVQGRTLAAATTQVSRVAAEYGQNGKLGQVVLAGHGSDTTMEMASDHDDTAAFDPEWNNVSYNGQADIDSKNDPKKNGTEALIDTILTSLDPATANLVFAGCLINSHDIDAKKSKLTGSNAKVEKRLRENIKKHPNLADYVQARMKATGTSVNVSAANASTTFDTFDLDANGKAQLNDPTDPDIGGTKLGYLRTGIEPEGVLRAALECCADPKVGIAGTAAEMDTRAKALAGSTEQEASCIRVAFTIALEGSSKHVNVATLVDLSHRIRWWSEAYVDSPAQRLADGVKKSEAKHVFPALLACGFGDDTNALFYQAWMKHDAGKATQFMTALGGSGMTVEQFKLQLSPGIVDSHLDTLLPISGTPTTGEMLLALTIADADRAVPKHVRKFLRAAAGGDSSRAFPAGLNVDTLYPNGAAQVLEKIGLSDKAPPPPGTAIDGNADLNSDGTNESHIDVRPHRAQVKAEELNVREKATTESKILGTLKKDEIIRVAGSTRHGKWSMIDFEGKVGFVSTHYLLEE